MAKLARFGLRSNIAESLQKNEVKIISRLIGDLESLPFLSFFFFPGNAFDLKSYVSEFYILSSKNIIGWLPRQMRIDLIWNWSYNDPVIDFDDCWPGELSNSTPEIYFFFLFRRNETFDYHYFPPTLDIFFFFFLKILTPTLRTLFDVGNRPWGADCAGILLTFFHNLSTKAINL